MLSDCNCSRIAFKLFYLVWFHDQQEIAHAHRYRNDVVLILTKTATLICLSDLIVLNARLSLKWDIKKINLQINHWFPVLFRNLLILCFAGA